MNILKRIGVFLMATLQKLLAEEKKEISDEMTQAIELWNGIARGKASWNKDAPSCGIAQAIAQTIADTIQEELDVESVNPILNNAMRSLDSDINEVVQKMVITGGCLCRPVFSNGRLQHELLSLGNYIPLEYDFDKTLTKCLITKNFKEGKSNFVLVEEHEFLDGLHKIQNRLYLDDNGTLKERGIKTTRLTENLEAEITWSNIEKPFVVEFRNPSVNTIDGSAMPVSLFAGIEKLIQEADEQFSRMTWEQEAGKMRVFADSDLFRRRQGDEGVDPKLAKMFVQFSGEVGDGNKIQTHAPQLRSDQQILAMNEILRRIETATNIGKGTISDLQDVRQTATQFAGGKKAFYSKIDTYEGELEKKYKAVAYVFAYMASAFLGVKFDDEIKIVFNDMSRKDPQQMKLTAMQEVSAGLLDKHEYRQMFYGEDEETARANVPEQVIGGFFA